LLVYSTVPVERVSAAGPPENEPPNFKSPAPVKLNWLPVVPVVTAPLMVTVPVEMEIILFLGVVDADMVRDPAVSVP